MNNNKKICLVTDYRETYTQGNYYQCYINGFKAIPNCTIQYLESGVTNLDSYDIVFIGHGATAQFRSHRYSIYFNLLEQTKAKKIIFTRNDYGPTLKDQQTIIDRLKPAYTVVNTRQSIAYYKNTQVIWIPFGIDPRFRDKKQERTIDIGFRGNLHLEWLDTYRDSFCKFLTKISTSYKTNIVTSIDGENFLQGEEYIGWLNSCKLVANTISASHTVGPKFIEAMACGCGIIAPPEEYEGLLKEDTNYVCIRSFEDKDKIDRYLNDEQYRKQMTEANNNYVRNNLTTTQITKLLEIV